ncbi:HIR complex subunit [Steccherinum ochraceum]|uniref:Protein HIR n=1 Tax=Steccherinum ochraceum TaxID=92696 RepID=A0A4R0RML5_9APHY|nr:HIR complex subunit [Steccherinum ochraceum]
MHTGPVLTVRWAHSGRWLASGSDDSIVMVWDLDPTAKGKVWGSDEVNVEGWKPLKRLPGHDSDVTDLAWSPEDRYLASVGLDSSVLIWCGYTLERLRKLDQHQGFVKGVCWDPVGEYLATQSDDRTVKIWRTTDWGLEAEVTKPFEDSPGTFFRRLSWSPDGAHITASNATNNSGYVFVAAVISRGNWTADISLVGHENAVQVAAYNPHIFLRNPEDDVVASNICSVVALGADDRSISVWQTKSARPLIVAKEVFERQIMDLSWSRDGYTLYAVSSDGTMAVFSFDRDELEGLAPFTAQEKYFTKFGFTAPPLPTGYSHSSLPSVARQTGQQQRDQRMTPPPSPKHNGVTAHTQDNAHTGFGSSQNQGGEHINKLVAKRKTAKRVQPTFMGSLASNIPSASTSNTPISAPPPSMQPTARPPPSANGRSFHEITGIASSSRQIPSPPSIQPQPYSATTTGFTDVSMNGESMGLRYPSEDRDVDMSTEVPITSFDAAGRSGKGKRKASNADILDEKPLKPRTLGGDRVREVVSVREISGGVPAVIVSSPSSGDSSLAGRLPIPSTLTYLKATIEGSEDVLEGRNSEDGGAHEVLLASGKQTQWLDYLPSPILALTATAVFCAAALQDGSLNIYSPTGRRIFPTLSLGAPCSILASSKQFLMLLTSAGMLHVWNVKKQQAAFAPVSVSSIMGISPNCSVLSASIRSNGAPYIHLSTGVAHSYDSSLLSWVKLSESWWAEGSDTWQGRQRANTQVAARGIVSAIEGSIAERIPGTDDERQRPAWWSTAMTLGHLESKLHAAKTLDSPQEYKHTLSVYAKKVADEGFRAKAEELVKELFGPTYWRPGRDDSWSPTVLGFSKRDLLKDVLTIFARSKTLTKLALDWQDILKKSAQEE